MTEEIKQRIKNTAVRLASIIDAGAPDDVILNEIKLLDELCGRSAMVNKKLDEALRLLGAIQSRISKAS